MYLQFLILIPYYLIIGQKNFLASDWRAKEPAWFLIDNKENLDASGLYASVLIGLILVLGGGGEEVVSHAEVFRGARISSFPTNTCSTENNTPFPQLANRKIDLDCRET